MELKIDCVCGQRYKFDVEPANGRMPGPVACPACGADGTEAGNAAIAQTLAAQPPASPVQPSAGSRPRIRLSSTHTEGTEPAAGPQTDAPIAASPPAPAAPMPGRPVATPSSSPPPRGLGAGILGAVLGGFVGMLAWFFLIKLTNREIGIAAWGVGVLTGYGARWLGRRGSVPLGVCAGICALVAILGGQFLAARSLVNDFVTSFSSMAYDEQLAYARRAVQVVTTGSDAEIKAFLESENARDAKGGNAAPVTPGDIKEFRDNELADLRDLASGKKTRKDVESELRSVADAMGGDMFAFKESLSLFMLLWLFLGIGSAYKVASS